MVMKKFINSAETLTKELLKGLALAFGDKIEVNDSTFPAPKHALNLEKSI